MKRLLAVGLLAVAQLGLTALAVTPQLSARTTGDTYRMRVEPLDPVDPFRGRYVTLRYPDLQVGDPEEVGAGHSIGVHDDNREGPLYLRLAEDDGLWGVDGVTRTRPGSGDFIACDDTGWEIRCGIESLFVNENRAPRIEEELADGAVVEVRIDARGNAAVVAIEAP